MKPFPLRSRKQITADGNATRAKIIRMIAEGKFTAEIAFDLGIAGNSLDYHKKIIARELGLTHFNVALVTRWAVYNGLVPAGLPNGISVNKKP